MLCKKYNQIGVYMCPNSGRVGLIWGVENIIEWVLKTTTIYEEIVFKMNASGSLYIFIGVTNFGFIGGENLTTSYDYDSLLDE